MHDTCQERSSANQQGSFSVCKSLLVMLAVTGACEDSQTRSFQGPAKQHFLQK